MIKPAAASRRRTPAGAGRTAAPEPRRASSGPPPGVASRTAGEATRRRIVEAALDTLRAEGFAGTTARSIAKRGGFNPALIFYHFGGVEQLLLAALDDSSTRRMARWREALAGVDTVTELIEVMRALYDEDVATAHVTAVQELVANSAFSDRLGPELVARMQPWVAFAEEVIERVVGNSPLRRAVDPRDLGFALIALYLGGEQVARLQGDSTRIDALFAAARRAAPAVDDLLGHAPRRRPRGGGRTPKRVPVSD